MILRCLPLVAGITFCTDQVSAHAPDLHYSVESLLEQRTGFGAATSGGAGGKSVVVTSSNDAGPGTLREAVEHNAHPVWVTFARDMEIRVLSMIHPGSRVTIDGRGKKVILLYNGIAIVGKKDVIISNIAIDGRFTGISQAINIANGSRNIWIDHLDLSRFNDRLLNVKTGSTDVTVSWSKFHDQNKVMLLNNITSRNLYQNWARDSASRVTLHHNWFVNTVQRNPRAQFGNYHVYNNLLENWDFYGMSFSLNARALVEGNIFSNNSQRECLEPSAFATVEGVARNYCAMISASGSRAQLPNGGSDLKSFIKSKGEYGYLPYQTPYAFLRVRDNLYLGSSKQSIVDAHADQVSLPPYRYTYDRPSENLAARIRSEAGNTAF